jgi:hypothetical protein
VHNLQWSGDNNQPSSSAIRLSEHFEWAYTYSTLTAPYCSFGNSMVAWCFRS